jgi:hypothetical protein
MAIQGQQLQATTEHWRDRLIAKASFLSDVWQVVLAWGAAAAEWIIYLCMFANILELFITFSPGLANGILATQSITLDVAGFGLASMASHALRYGNEEAAKKAQGMSNTLIVLMVITVLLMAIGHISLFKPIYQYLGWIETGLILVRLVISVFYSHVVHSVREANASTPAPIPLNQATDFLKRFEEIEAKIEERFKNLSSTLSAQTSTTALVELQEQLKLQAEQLKNLKVELQQSKTLNTVNHPVATFTGPAPAPATSTTPSATNTATAPSSTQVKPRNEPVLLHRVQATEQSRNAQAPKSNKAASEAPAPSSNSKQSFNKTAFVVDCLRENPAISSAEIKERAAKLNQTISDPIISMARKDFKSQSLKLKVVGE